MSEKLVFTYNVNNAIREVLSELQYDKCFVLCDENSYVHAGPMLASLQDLLSDVIVIPPTDFHKNLDTLTAVWQRLICAGASRQSLLINVGGGVVTDLGGMAAATFKRGIRYINVPTTLLGIVDAAVGGKTGINFEGLKNEIGVFARPEAVLVTTEFMTTLPREELLSGYAEMIKHALIDGEEHYRDILGCDVINAWSTMLPIIRRSIAVKQRLVELDPHEQSVRKMLNLGHTVGHAFESHALAQGTPIRHGYAVAWGLVCELLIAHRRLNFPSAIIYDLARYIERYYGAYVITCNDYNDLYSYLLHDKKNYSGRLNFTLLRNLGDCVVDCHVTQDEVEIALDFYRDLFHL